MAHDTSIPGLLEPDPHVSSGADAPEQKMARSLLRRLTDWTPESAYERMAAHYALLKLRGPDGRWESPLLEARSPALLPRDIDRAKLAQFVEQVATVAGPSGFRVGPRP